MQAFRQLADVRRSAPKILDVSQTLPDVLIRPIFPTLLDYFCAMSSQSQNAPLQFGILVLTLLILKIITIQ